MVNISLDSTWSLVSDSNNWMLVSDGRAEKFYQSLEGALKGYINIKQKGSNAQRFEDLVQFTKNLKKSLSEALMQLSTTLCEEKVKAEGLKKLSFMGDL